MMVKRNMKTHWTKRYPPGLLIFRVRSHIFLLSGKMGHCFWCVAFAGLCPIHPSDILYNKHSSIRITYVFSIFGGALPNFIDNESFLEVLLGGIITLPDFKYLPLTIVHSSKFSHRFRTVPLWGPWTSCYLPVSSNYHQNFPYFKRLHSMSFTSRTPIIAFPTYSYPNLPVLRTSREKYRWRAVSLHQTGTVQHEMYGLKCLLDIQIAVYLI